MKDHYFLKDSYLDLQSLNPLFALRCSVPYLPKRELMATIPAQSFRCLLLTPPITEWSHSRANRSFSQTQGFNHHMFAYRNLRKASRKITMQTAQTFYRLIGRDSLAALLPNQSRANFDFRDSGCVKAIFG